MSGDVPKKPGLRYSDSPHAPDWARDPALRGGNRVTSFGQPILQAGEEAPGKPQELHYSDSPYAPEWARHPSEHKPKPVTEPDEPFRPSVEWFEELLWKEASEDVRVYAIMDGYWAKGLYGRLLASPDVSWAHMFQGDVALNNIQDAPFIIALQRGHKLLRWLIEEGWGDGWGIYFTASTKAALERYGATARLPPDMAPSNEERVRLCNLVEGMGDPLWLMRRHFRMFSDVEFEDDGRVVDFRYYDPATLRIYLPSCNNYELRQFCGPIHHFYAEDYCEVESLNCSHRICRFAAWPDENMPMNQQFNRSDPAMLFEALQYDMVAKKTATIPRSSVSERRVGRESGIWFMVSSLQYELFSEKAYFNFREHIADVLIKNYKNIIPLSSEKIRNDVYLNIDRGMGYGLTTRSDLVNFLICSLKYGKSFPDKFREAKSAFDNSGGVANWSLSVKLHSWATTQLPGA